MPTQTRPRSALPGCTATVWLLLVCACCGARLWAAPPGGSADSPTGLRSTVARHIAELASPLRSERVRAEQALLELGPRILEWLPSPEESTDQATRIAVRQVRIKLERVAAEQSVLPSRVNLLGEATIAGIAEQISRQTGNPIDVSELPAADQQRQVNVDFRETPFWECLDRFAEEAHLYWYPAKEQPELRLTGPVQLPAGAQTAYAGAFRIRLAELTPQRGTVRASLQLQAEPRLRPLFVRFADANFSAVAGDTALPPFSPRAVTELPMTSLEPPWFAVQFQAADAKTLPPLTIRGSANVHIAAAPVEVRFDDLSGKKVVYLRRGGVSVTLKRSTLSPGANGTKTLSARLAIAYDTGGPEFESHRTWIYHNDVRLESPDGTSDTPDGGFDVTQQLNGGVEVDYHFSGLPERPLRDWQLVYVAPTLLIDVPVEFAFENVRVRVGK